MIVSLNTFKNTHHEPVLSICAPIPFEVNQTIQLQGKIVQPKLISDAKNEAQIIQSLSKRYGSLSYNAGTWEINERVCKCLTIYEELENQTRNNDKKYDLEKMYK